MIYILTRNGVVFSIFLKGNGAIASSVIYVATKILKLRCSILNLIDNGEEDANEQSTRLGICRIK
jgi:hypothetical protein